MTKDMAFESGRLFYCGINLTDTDNIVRWRSDPELIKYFRTTIPITKESHLNWYENLYIKDPTRFDFVIVEKESRVGIGTVGAANIDRADGSFEISYMIGEPNFQRKGYASEAIAAMLRFMRSEGIRTAIAEIHKDNTASVNMVQKLGFTERFCNGDFIKFIYFED